MWLMASLHWRFSERSWANRKDGHRCSRWSGFGLQFWIAFMTDLPDVVQVAVRVHDAWVEMKLAEGSNSAMKQLRGQWINLLVPWAELPAAGRHYCLGKVQAVYRAIREEQQTS